jgi:hypothetical protein
MMKKALKSVNANFVKILVLLGQINANVSKLKEIKNF